MSYRMQVEWTDLRRKIIALEYLRNMGPTGKTRIVRHIKANHAHVSIDLDDLESRGFVDKEVIARVQCPKCGAFIDSINPTIVYTITPKGNKALAQWKEFYKLFEGEHDE